VRGQSTGMLILILVLNYGIAVLAGLFCIAAVVLGIHAMTTKS
jgi:hypothetical protein